MTTQPQVSLSPLKITAPISEAHATVLTKEALNFLGSLTQEFEARRQELLEAQARPPSRDRRRTNARFPSRDSPSAAGMARGSYSEDLMDRRVEITGPVDRKMVINASTAAPAFSWPISRTPTRPPGEQPRWPHQSARRGEPDHRIYEPEGKRYKLNEKTATLLVRPRWHLNEKHVLSGGKPISGRCSISACISSTT
jgi:malate synthase